MIVTGSPTYWNSMNAMKRHREHDDDGLEQAAEDEGEHARREGRAAAPASRLS